MSLQSKSHFTFLPQLYLCYIKHHFVVIGSVQLSLKIVYMHLFKMLFLYDNTTLHYCIMCTCPSVFQSRSPNLFILILTENMFACQNYLHSPEDLPSPSIKITCLPVLITYTQRRVQPDQCYFTVQMTGINFECSLQSNSTVIVCIALLLHII